ncbi:cell envelope integrity protein CreD [Massilia sp. Dwa41.01b]|uniref:cell envelope integrity protein CreD n=1 Tax=unclassified Massilia TaxID=2609279 RepID=UPI001600450A|nr:MULTISPECIES: cell envelope integrity protein CreD [unclassified Massilia]QNA90221.1 cell envelope integrity protein CreD [Massilia sp. Dwa41.01b]QNB01108.1 cell envelope integrity protein CreD [Massilia sp. Se16.2.3]
MQRTLLFKILTIVGLILLICVPLTMIENMIETRSAYRAEAVESVASSSVREQTVVGPVLVIQYTDDYEEKVDTGDPAGKAVVNRSVQREHLVFPNDLQINGKIDTFKRKRGIFNVLYYKGVHEMAGEFTVPNESVLPRATTGSRITVNSAKIAVGIDDVRGVQRTPKLNWDGTEIGFRQGTGLRSLPSGLHANLARISLDSADKPIRFHFSLALDGTEQQHIVPVGNNNRLTIASNWPHPAFGGQFLPMPEEQPQSSPGFRRSWNISNVSNNSQAQLVELERAPQRRTTARTRPHIDAVSIAFIEPVDVYTLSARATKYGLLFVALTFAAFFMFEILKTLPIHPVQYLLVGLALALFFLLLIALSEHIAFWQAYLVASAACIVLISYYLSAVLADWRRGVGFACGLTALYGSLYGLLVSENNALVLGSLLLFAILGAIMVATRKVNWYQIGQAA